MGGPHACGRPFAASRQILRIGNFYGLLTDQAWIYELRIECVYQNKMFRWSKSLRLSDINWLRARRVRTCFNDVSKG